MTAAHPALLITTGEPAGIGPDITLTLALGELPVRLAAVADPALLDERRNILGLTVDLVEIDGRTAPPAHRPGRLAVIPERLAAGAQPGTLNPANAPYVLRLLSRGVAACTAGPYHGMVTAPVHKGVINDAGIPFTGHTEHLAELTGARRPVMLLVRDRLRVALVTTHLPLAQVAAAIDEQRITEVAEVLHQGLKSWFGIARPRILVCGLNPHAGEGGHLGSEEIEIIAPALAALRQRGVDVRGPVPADTAFTPARLDSVDAVLAMFHDQGLPVIKAAGFGDVVNVTLGLPVVRTSVDHGTALELAATGRASAASLRRAVLLAGELCRERRAA